MDAAGSITQWISQFKDGDDDAFLHLWNRYWRMITELAHSRLPHGASRQSDGEDVALEAFHEFSQRLKRGRFSQIENRNDLRKLLTTITVRKAATQFTHEQRQKRGGGRVRGDSALYDIADQCKDPKPTPEEVVVVEDLMKHVLESMGDYRQIAELHLAGYGCGEIAREMNCSTRTIQRKLRVIYHRFEEIFAEHLDEES